MSQAGEHFFSAGARLHTEIEMHRCAKEHNIPELMEIALNEVLKIISNISDRPSSLRHIVGGVARIYEVTEEEEDDSLRKGVRRNMYLRKCAMSHAVAASRLPRKKYTAVPELNDDFSRLGFSTDIDEAIRDLTLNFGRMEMSTTPAHRRSRKARILKTQRRAGRTRCDGVYHRRSGRIRR